MKTESYMGKPKTENAYSQLLISDFYSACPKAVFAGLAVSFLVNHLGIGLDVQIQRELLKEWYRLYLQGIIPQCPPRKLWKVLDEPMPKPE